MRASVIMPRSPTTTTRLSLKRSFSLLIWLATVAGSAVLPSNTSTAPGHPSEAHTNPMTSCGLGPFVPAVAVMGKRAVASFKIGRRDVVEHQRAFPPVAAGGTGVDEGLLGYQPVKGGVDLANRDGAEAERLAEGMAGRGGVEHARGGEFGRRIEQAGDDQRENEIAPALRRTAGSRPSRPIRRAVASAART